MKREQCIVVYTSMVLVDNESECTKDDSARRNQYFSIKRIEVKRYIPSIPHI